MRIVRNHPAPETKARHDNPARSALLFLPILLALFTMLPGRATSVGAVNLANLPPHPRFFLTDARVSALRTEVTTGPKSSMYNEIRGRAAGYFASPASSSIWAVLNLALVGKVDQNASYMTKAAEYFNYAISQGAWGAGEIEWAIGYDWVYPYLTAEQRSAARQLALPIYPPGNQRTVYYNLEAIEAMRGGLIGLTFYGEGSPTENQKCQDLVDECDGRMRGVRQFAYPGGTAMSKGGVLPTRQFYFPDGGYYKGVQYGQIDMEGIVVYLSLFQDLGLGNYWDLCGSYLDNWPQYLLYMMRPDWMSQRLMSGTNYSLIPLGYESLALISAYRGNPYAAWLLNNGPWNISEGGYGWALLCAFWRPTSTVSAPSTLPLARLYGADGRDNLSGTSWSEKVVLRSGWNLNGDNDDAYFTLHAGGYFGDYWNFYQLAFEVYYRGALAIRSGYYAGGDLFLKNYNSRAVAANCVVVLDETRSNLSDRWGEDFLYDSPGPGRPVHIHDVADDTPFDMADVLFYEEKPLSDGGKSYYVKGALNPAAAYYYTNGTRKVSLQTREVASLGRYYVIRDKVIQNGSTHSVRFLLHTINRPVIEGGVSPISVTVPDHIITYPRARYHAERTELVPRGATPPIQYGGKIWVEPVIPAGATLRLVGGDGYEFWVDDGNGAGQNFVPDGITSDDYTNEQEMGKWRVETIAPSAQTVDFVHAIYTGPTTGSMAEVRPIDQPTAVGCEIAGQGVFIFGRSSSGETGIDYQITGELLNAPQLIEGLMPGIEYAVRIGEDRPFTARSSSSGGLTFNASGPARVAIQPANLAQK